MKENILKKEFKKSDVSRVRNIINKKYGDSTKTQLGFSKQQEFHTEGSFWEENGKKWTIKNGIKQNITKLDSFKKSVNLPIICPNCNAQMKHSLDAKFYRIHEKCFDCVIKYETQLRLDGKYEEYEKEMVKKNALAHIKDLEQAFEDYLNTNESFITEQGDMENWKDTLDKDKARLEFNDYINQLKTSLGL